MHYSVIIVMMTLPLFTSAIVLPKYHEPRAMKVRILNNLSNEPIRKDKTIKEVEPLKPTTIPLETRTRKVVFYSREKPVKEEENIQTPNEANFNENVRDRKLPNIHSVTNNDLDDLDLSREDKEIDTSLFENEKEDDLDLSDFFPKEIISSGGKRQKEISGVSLDLNDVILELIKLRNQEKRNEKSINTILRLHRSQTITEEVVRHNVKKLQERQDRMEVKITEMAALASKNHVTVRRMENKYARIISTVRTQRREQEVTTDNVGDVDSKMADIEFELNRMKKELSNVTQTNQKLSRKLDENEKTIDVLKTTFKEITKMDFLNLEESVNDGRTHREWCSQNGASENATEEEKRARCGIDAMKQPEPDTTKSGLIMPMKYLTATFDEYRERINILELEIRKVSEKTVTVDENLKEQIMNCSLFMRNFSNGNSDFSIGNETTNSSQIDVLRMQNDLEGLRTVLEQTKSKSDYLTTSQRELSLQVQQYSSTFNNTVRRETVVRRAMDIRLTTLETLWSNETLRKCDQSRNQAQQERKIRTIDVEVKNLMNEKKKIHHMFRRWAQDTTEIDNRWQNTAQVVDALLPLIRNMSNHVSDLMLMETDVNNMMINLPKDCSDGAVYRLQEKAKNGSTSWTSAIKPEGVKYPLIVFCQGLHYDLENRTRKVEKSKGSSETVTSTTMKPLTKTIGTTTFRGPDMEVTTVPADAWTTTTEPITEKGEVMDESWMSTTDHPTDEDLENEENLSYTTERPTVENPEETNEENWVTTTETPTTEEDAEYAEETFVDDLDETAETTTETPDQTATTTSVAMTTDSVITTTKAVEMADEPSAAKRSKKNRKVKLDEKQESESETTNTPASVYVEKTLTTSRKSVWTVIQRRMNYDEDFDRSWNEYKQGFGNVNHDFWLGNEPIHLITFGKNYELLIEMWNERERYFWAYYKEFELADEGKGYQLHLSGYQGNATDAFSDSAGMRFSTPEYDNDAASINCAKFATAGWWYRHCQYCNLNGRPRKGIIWFDSRKGSYRVMKRTRMMIRPRAE